MDVEIRIPVCIGYLGRIDMREPVVGSEFFTVFQYHTTDTISDVGIFIDPPVNIVQVFIHRFGDINSHVFIRPRQCPLMTITDI